MSSSMEGDGSRVGAAEEGRDDTVGEEVRDENERKEEGDEEEEVF